MESLACLDGEMMPVDQARIPIWDRGFLFGDAVYEVYPDLRRTPLARSRAHEPG